MTTKRTDFSPAPAAPGGQAATLTDALWRYLLSRQAFSVSDEPLQPGQVTPEHFDRLLAGTSIRGKTLLKALREHFVDGKPSLQAIQDNQVNRSHFYNRRRTVLKEHQRIAALSRFYVRPVDAPAPSLEELLAAGLADAGR